MLQQAHPGIAAASDILLGQAALDSTGNTTQAVSNGSTETEQSIGDGGSTGDQQGFGADGQGSEQQIPWRQVAGLLHSQGITDPQGLVSMHVSLLSAQACPGFCHAAAIVCYVCYVMVAFTNACSVGLQNRRLDGLIPGSAECLASRHCRASDMAPAVYSCASVFWHQCSISLL